MEYDSYKFRTYKKYRDSLTKKERDIILILMAFGATIDPHKYDDGDYKEAVERLKSI